ncbi:MAG: hypothetical protein ACI8PB_002585 [Desulforhopalus sp.]|jgi:hypothetical protein
MSEQRHSASFRDPSGFLFRRNEIIYRQVNHLYRKHYEKLMLSGLYDRLVKQKLLIPHKEVTDIGPPDRKNAYKVLKPECIPFISYPYEWCFSQLKDSALLTLNIHKIALESGMILKDASAYNVQFLNGLPVFIDTLSFETYKEGSLWPAYRQFCQHFLAPLALMSKKDIRLSQLLKVYLDGIPLELASSLLPGRSYLSLSLLSHIHFHAKGQKHFEDKLVKIKPRKLRKTSHLALIDNLSSSVRKLQWQPEGTEWGEYYDDTNYSKDAFEHKKKIVSDFLDQSGHGSVWDLGANTGVFSKIAAGKGRKTISFDVDQACVEKNYTSCKESGERNVLPLVMDFVNPSSGIGWENKERYSLDERAQADTVMALALIHHLAISNNLPLNLIAGFFSRICQNLIIEFTPKSDSQVQRLLMNRVDIFPEYKQEFFEKEFSVYFNIKNTQPIPESERIIYLLQCKI